MTSAHCRLIALSIAIVATFQSEPIPAQDSQGKLTFLFASTADVKLPDDSKLSTETTLRYTFQKQDTDVSVLCDAIELKIKIKDEETQHTKLSSELIYNKEKGKAATEIKYADADPKLKQTLESFGSPLCKLELDQTGKEVKRTILAGPAGRAVFVNQGMLTNMRFFHVPFPAKDDSWVVSNEITVGQAGQTAKGALRYEKKDSKNSNPKLITVRVSGTLKADNIGGAAAPLSSRVTYIVSGEQTYSLQQKEWVAGNLLFDVTIDYLRKEEKVATSKGAIKLSLTLLAP